jgi:hypothetical protein
MRSTSSTVSTTPATSTTTVNPQRNTLRLRWIVTKEGLRMRWDIAHEGSRYRESRTDLPKAA